MNRRNGPFSEIGLYAGIAATDWSWSPLWVDFDNDGIKDLFISNGIPKRLNDIDYINFISNVELQEKMRSTGLDEKDMNLIDRFPQLKSQTGFLKTGRSFSLQTLVRKSETTRKHIPMELCTQILTTTVTSMFW